MSESEFHYVRVAGDDGGVDAVDGRAIGVDLETILKDGLPPFKVALEIIAALCEILDISDQDGETHGDIHPRNVFIDDTGAISIEGFGLEPEQVWAPEGELLGPITDLYGLGYTAFRLLSTRDLTDLPNNADGHDDAVIDAVIALPWGDMPEEWVGDIQWFLAKLMSFEPDQRPTAVESWRTFIAFASDAEGVALMDWAPDAIEGGGERRDAAMAVRPAVTEEEDLGGPVVKSVGLQKGAISFGGGSAKSGQATAFWSKEQMKAALDAENEDDDPGDAPEEAPAFKPKAAAATSFWTRDQMEAMARGEGDAPRPKRKEGAAPRQTAPAAPPPPVAHKPSAPPPVAPPPVAPPPVSPPPIAGGPMAGGPIAGGPVAGGPVAGGPVVGGPVASAADDDDEESGGGSKMGLIIGAVVVVLILLCGGAAAIGGIGYMMTSGSTSASTEPSKPSSAAREEPAEKVDTAVEEVTPTAEPTAEPDPEPIAPTRAPDPAPTPAPTPSTRSGSTTSTPATRSGSSTPATRSGSSTPATRSGTTSTPRTRGSTTSTATKPATGPTRVIFTVPGSGTVRCGDGSSADLTDKGSLTVNLTAGGETCSFVAGGKPVCAGFVEPGNRKCTCDAGSGALTCE